MDLPVNLLGRTGVAAAATALTAGMYFASFGLHPVWWLVWLAPLPLLLVVPVLRAWQAFALAFVARALPGLDLWHYMRQSIEVPVLIAAAIVVVPAALFALAVMLYRGVLGKRRHWLAAIAFPMAVVAFEYLYDSLQGTFGNTGYTQLKNLPVLQLAALAGLWGISFAVNLFPAAVAVLAWSPGRVRVRMGVALAAFYACVLSYGWVRLNNVPAAPHSVVVGAVETHAGSTMFPPDAASTMALMQSYAEKARQLAAQGAEFVVVPEMTGLVPDAAMGKVDAIFEQAAREAHVQVLLDIIHITGGHRYNEARLYSEEGRVETVYRKHHLVPTLESRTTPGTGIAVVAEPVGTLGIEICRDMDYENPARRYGQRGVGLLLVPAWDQAVDAVWHGHMALMRGVENGFTMVRDAKVGLLTASDDRGRILDEMSTSADGAFVTMLVRVPMRHDATLYQAWGDWFAWVDLLAVAGLGAWVMFGAAGRDRVTQAKPNKTIEYTLRLER